MSSFDLNIKNYSIEDLEKILGLSSGYSKIHVEQNTERMRENIISDDSVDEIIKRQTILFLNEVKTKLLASEISSYIVNKPRTEYASSFPSEFYEGDLNPIHKRTITQNLNVDTRFRDNYLTTNSGSFHVDLPMTITNILSMQLTAFEPPLEIYNITKDLGNHFMIIMLNTGVNKILILENGIYTNTSVVDALNALCIADSELNGNITFSLSPITKKITIQSSLGDAFNINFAGDSLGIPLPLKLGWMLGFRTNLYVNSTSYTSDMCADLSGFKYMYLSVDDFNNNVNNGFYSAFNSSVLNKNILARISVSNVLTGTFVYTSTRRDYFGPVDIKKIKIQLLDEYGRVIDTKNMDYSFCLSFNISYDL